jgi:hypothetical protein
MLAVSPAFAEPDRRWPSGVRRGRIGAVSGYAVSGWIACLAFRR